VNFFEQFIGRSRSGYTGRTISGRDWLLGERAMAVNDMSSRYLTRRCLSRTHVHQPGDLEVRRKTHFIPHSKVEIEYTVPESVG
jgi:hypothetical protein